MDNPFSLKDKTILVTGASSGIGRGIAIACAQMGANVIITARNEGRLRETMAKMVGENHTVIVADLVDVAQRALVVEQLPLLDGVVHCAGVGSRVPCKNIEGADIEHVMQPNFYAPVLLQAELLSSKKIGKSASIVFIASRAAEMPSVGNAVYSASKGAIISYAKCLALELAPRKIRVNCICPAMVWTDLAFVGASREQLEQAEQQYPLKRYGTPEDIAYLSIYMLSGASSWMTGSCVDITGGGEGIIA
jgi:NAD(P)-dependent dehydrogenase (short-subunit alcohol dehydrogenase family)